jgi:CTP:molybdopterin cytidylyltransferase MocA
MHKSRKITALILAAGFSSRMGSFKPLLPLGETSVIANAVNTFRQAGIQDVRVVLGHRAVDLLPVLAASNVTAVFNPQYADEMYLSVIAGLDTFAAGTEAFFLLPCDMPLVRAHTIKAMQRKFCETDAAIIYPTFQGQRGHPPLITAQCFASILAWQGQGGLKTLFERFSAQADEVEVPDQGIIMDMDTPQDYEEVCNYFSGKDIPTVQECEVILHQFQTPKQVITHGQTVAKVACCLAECLYLVGIKLNKDLVRAGALLHDMAKTTPNHARRGARQLMSVGYPNVARVVGAHMDLVFDHSTALDEKAIVYLADKLVVNEQIISINKRLHDVRVRFADQSEALVAATRRMRTALLIQEKIAHILGIGDFEQFMACKGETQWTPST